MYRPFMAVESQVQQLNRRGLQTDMRTPWILEREGYYSVVNGYKDPLLTGTRILFSIKKPEKEHMKTDILPARRSMTCMLFSFLIGTCDSCCSV